MMLKEERALITAAAAARKELTAEAMGCEQSKCDYSIITIKHASCSIEGSPILLA